MDLARSNNPEWIKSSTNNNGLKRPIPIANSNEPRHTKLRINVAGPGCERSGTNIANPKQVKDCSGSENPSWRKSSADATNPRHAELRIDKGKPNSARSRSSTKLPGDEGKRQKSILFIGCDPLPVTNTTRILTFLLGNPYKPISLHLPLLLRGTRLIHQFCVLPFRGFHTFMVSAWTQQHATKHILLHNIPVRTTICIEV